MADILTSPMIVLLFHVEIRKKCVDAYDAKF